MVERLSYVVEDSTLAELLGKQNFSTDESAILELVKNAFDAGAQTLKILFSNLYKCPKWIPFFMDRLVQNAR